MVDSYARLRQLRRVVAGGKQWETELQPYEIKTLKLQKDVPVAVNILEES